MRVHILFSYYVLILCSLNGMHFQCGAYGGIQVVAPHFKSILWRDDKYLRNDNVLVGLSMF